MSKPITVQTVANNDVRARLQPGQNPTQGNPEPWSEYNGKPGVVYRGNAVDHAPVRCHPSYDNMMQASTSTSASPPGEVVRAMLDLQDQTDRLHASLRMLRDKIGSTLTPEGPPANDAACGAIADNRSEHAYAIRIQVRTVSDACDLIENMIDRTEL